MMEVVRVFAPGIKSVLANSGTALTERQISLMWKCCSSPIFCLDGDGSLLMHLGAMRTIGVTNKSGLKHILLNNNSHESVGAQPTYADGINFKNLSKSLGYKNYFQITKKQEIEKKIKKFISVKGPSLLEVKIQNRSLKNLGRPKNLVKVKNKFMKN